MSTYKGACNCGAITFTVSGDPIFNLFCHCRACSRARGVSPSHLYAVPNEQFSIDQGEEHLQVKEGMGRLVHAICIKCGCHIYQCPDGAKFRAVLPVNFHIETPDSSNPCGVSCKLPKELLPTAHVNYENRLMDVEDDLPKYTAFSSSPRLNNDGRKYEG